MHGLAIFSIYLRASKRPL